MPYKSDLEKYKKKTNKLDRYKTSTDPKQLSEYQHAKTNESYARSALDQYNLIRENDMNAKAQLSIAKQKAMQYTPTQMKTQGLSGTGVAETTKSNIRNAYMNSIGQQNARTDFQESQLLQRYRNQVDTNDMNYQSALSQYNMQEQAQLADKIVEYQDTLSSANSIEEFDGYLSTLKKEGGLSDNQIDMLLQTPDIQRWMLRFGYNSKNKTKGTSITPNDFDEKNPPAGWTKKDGDWTNGKEHYTWNTYTNRWEKVGKI